jgi:hypothetical protein
MSRSSGGQIDPQVVGVFLGIPEDDWLAIASSRLQIASFSPQCVNWTDSTSWSASTNSLAGKPRAH